MDVIILAGGLGTRLRSMVHDMPKCMAAVEGKPFLYYLFSYLSRFPIIKKMILSLGYKNEVVTDWIKTQKNFDFKYIYSIEEKPLGTGGAVKKALDYANSELVLIVNGDSFFDVDLNLFLRQHTKSDSLLSVALKPMKTFERYGNVVVNEQSVITSFQEKIFCENGQINGGVYLFTNNRNILDGFPCRFSFETEFLQPQVNSRNIYGFIHNGYFIDIGIPEDYIEANKVFHRLFP
jgi:D-glycero-alpha-D-manno-heptose 1-phosphate guanylyltransferase